jgi:SAM-dependent methyltransferase
MPVERVPELGVKFDVVLFLGVYCHLRDPLRALGILRSVLNDGGMIVVEGMVWCKLAQIICNILVPRRQPLRPLELVVAERQMPGRVDRI